MMWFGTRNFERWVPDFETGPTFGKEAWGTETTGLNGGAWVRNSTSSHRVYTVTWPPVRSRDELRPIADFADGVYDDHDGVNLIYFIDPVAADRNVAPQGLAFPGQSDAMPLVRGIHPKLVPTAPNALGYPARSAQYTFAGTETPVPLYIPIPPGFTLWFGVHGTIAADTGFNVTPYTKAVAAAPVVPAALGVDDTARVNAPFTAPYTGVEIAVIPSGTPIISSVIVQVLPNGATPQTGGFISGQGHSGCQFVGKPAQTVYTVAKGRDQIGMSAKLTETGAWL